MNPLFKNVPILTEDQEDDLLRRYRDGDSEAGGVLVHAHAPWIRNIILQMKVKPWVSHEDLFCDVMPEVLAALKTFNRNGSAALKTYLYVAIHRAVVKCAKMHEMGPGIDDIELEAPEECESGVVTVIHSLVNALPDSEINETGRKLVSRMLRGYDIEEIASQMGFTVPDTIRAVEQMRRFIAYLMVVAGHSAEPFISDATLSSLAEEHMRQKESWFR